MEIMKPNTDKSMTVRLPADLAGQLEKLIVAALRDYVEAKAWQVQDTLQGITEADRGALASDSEVNAFFAKYGS